MGKYLRRILPAALLVILLGSSGAAVPAAPSASPTPAASSSSEAAKAAEPAKKQAAGKWVKKKGYYYYYNGRKKLKNGIFKIDGRKYCFDRKGRQLTGWRKSGKKAYYFRNANGKKGYMLTGRKVDGIKLKKSGKAAPSGDRPRKKLKVVLEAQKLADRAVKPDMPKKKKLRAVFEFVQKHFSMRVIPELGVSGSCWDLNYAEYMMEHGCGDCYCYAAVFAYLANAVGYHDVLTVNDTGHGWVEIGGRYYDPHWDLCIKASCYAIPRSLSGTEGRVAFAGNGVNKKNCDK